MTAMIIIITIIIPTLSADLCVCARTVLSWCVRVVTCSENTVRTLARGFHEPCSFAWSLDMTSRHHPFVFHKQYVLTLRPAGATCKTSRKRSSKT